MDASVKDKSIEKREELTETGGYISKLVLNNANEIHVNENDIVVFVGPNNAGKSQV